MIIYPAKHLLKMFAIVMFETFVRNQMDDEIHPFLGLEANTSQMLKQ
jgi:hypothetical protein